MIKYLSSFVLSLTNDKRLPENVLCYPFEYTANNGWDQQWPEDAKLSYTMIFVPSAAK
jgi:hypothetical protein